MASESRTIRPITLALFFFLLVVAGLYFYLTLSAPAQGAAATLPRLTGRLVDRPTFLAYVPEGWKSDHRSPLVFALSPGGDAAGALYAWAAVADRHQWVVAASREFRNGQPFGPSLEHLDAELTAIEAEFAVDPHKVIITGLSGGAMGSHAYAKFHPDRVRAVVPNTGMMSAPFMTADYPEGKLAVFLASPTDFRYGEMKRDFAFLESHHWKLQWYEFAGGHRLAPQETYEAAAAWLEEQLRD